MQEALALNPSLCKRFSYIQGEKNVHEEMWCWGTYMLSFWMSTEWKFSLVLVLGGGNMECRAEGEGTQPKKSLEPKGG